jgi:recombinational DNA repair protein RecT
MSAQPKPESTAVVRTVEPQATPHALRTKIGKILTTDQARAAIAPLIPHGVSLEVVVAEAYRQTVKNPEILECTNESIIDAVASVVQSGLVIGKTVHLVPVRDNKANVTKLQAWNDYKGDIELVARAGWTVTAHAVYENEIDDLARFSLELGTVPRVMHRPFLDSKKRGELAGAYAVAAPRTSGGMPVVEFMTVDDVNKIRASSRGWKALAKCPDWYAIKTVIHRVCKQLPKGDAKLDKALEIIERQRIADAEEVDAEVSSAAADDSEAVVYELKDRALPALATEEHKARIAELLDSADIDEEERIRVAGVAGRSDYKAKDAIAEIARLEALSKQPTEE